MIPSLQFGWKDSYPLPGFELSTSNTKELLINYSSNIATCFRQFSEYHYYEILLQLFVVPSCQRILPEYLHIKDVPWFQRYYGS